jgi:hypothetical protein
VSSALPVPVATRAHCEAFASAAEALARRQAGRIPEKDVQDLQALGWLEWRQGALRVTPLGQMALIRIQGTAAQPA